MSNNHPSGSTVSALNNKAIQLVQQGDARAAVKLFLQALTSLKSQVSSNPTSSSVTAASEAAFVRIALPTSSPSAQGMMTFSTLFGLNPTVDPCAPQQRDGSTACLLFNMALSHHQRCSSLDQHQQARVAHLKKASMTYNMAFKAAQHWKKFTVSHSGLQILTLAIVNNLLVVHHELSTLCNNNSEKVQQLHTLLRDTLFGQATGDEIHCEELSLFAKNLQRCTSPADEYNSDNSSTKNVQQQASPCSSNDVAAPAAQPAIVGAHSA